MIEKIKDGWSSQGRRVILLARRILSREQATSRDMETTVLERSTGSLTLVGLVSIVDPPRGEIPEVVRTLRGAGIRIFMVSLFILAAPKTPTLIRWKVTGDFALTAQAIAKECGIISNEPSLVKDVKALSRNAESDYTKAKDPVQLDQLQGPRTHTSIVLSGPEMISLNENQWDKLCGYDEIVFARTTPEQKLRIVREFQARNGIVAMTGDGVNDAPSLKAADIGIALGSGSDIAIEAADMVLLESFSAIVEAVQYGRVVFDNLKKTIAYLLPAGSFSEFWPVFTNVLFGLPQVLSSFLMIMIW